MEKCHRGRVRLRGNCELNQRCLEHSGHIFLGDIDGDQRALKWFYKCYTHIRLETNIYPLNRHWYPFLACKFRENRIHPQSTFDELLD